VFRMRHVWRTRSTQARPALAGAAMLLALTVGACSPREGGAAAVIGDRRITTEQVSAAVTGIERGNPQLGQNEGLDRTVLFFMIVSPYVLRAAEGKGVGVSDAQAAELLAQDATPDPDAVRVLRTYLALQGLQGAQATAELQRVQQEVAAAKPRLNPRYGRFDTQELTVAETAPNWLAPKAGPTGPVGPTNPVEPSPGAQPTVP
jgi:hypothetical protein